MPYSISTKDGIKINNIPDDIDPSSNELKTRVDYQRRKRDFDTDPTKLIPGMEESNVIPSDPTFTDRIVGAGETALTLGTGATTGALGYAGGFLKGLGKEIVTGGYGSHAGADRVEQAATQGAAALTYAPRTTEGQRQTKAVGETMQPLAAIAPHTGQFAGISAGTARQAVNTAKSAATVPKSVFKYQTPVKQKIAKLIEAGSTDIETAKYKISAPATTGLPLQETNIGKYLNIGGAKIAADSVAKGAIKQGFDEGVIAAIKGSSKADKLKMLKMLHIMERGKKNQKFAVLNRPADVAGDTLTQRVKTIVTANKKAGLKLDFVAKALKGKSVDHAPAVDRFMNKLSDMGIDFDGAKINYFGSDVEGLKGPQAIINNIVKRMKDTKAPDAYDVHRLKKFIDENVSYGKSTQKLSGKAQTIVKQLRHDLDSILDNSFPEYNKTNTIYADTRTSLDGLQKAAGPNTNLFGPNTDKALGTLLRRTMGNYQSRVKLLDSLDTIEKTAIKHGGSALPKLKGAGLGSDDLIMQTLFVDELDRVFGPVARSSFQGQIEQAVKQSAKVASGTAGTVDAGVSMIGKGAEKLRGINQSNAFKIMRNLLQE